MIARSIITFMFMLILSLTIIFDTDIGLLILIKIIPGDAHAEKISGSIFHGFNINKLDYYYDGTTINLKKFIFDWQWQDLLKQTLTIDNIQVKGLKIKISSLSSSKSDAKISLSNIDLPINIYLKQLTLENVDIYNDNKKYTVKKVSLSGDLISNLVKIKQLSILTPDIQLESNGKANINTWDNITIANNISFFSYPTLPISTTITGDKNILSLKIKSSQWLDITLKLTNYLNSIEDITINSHWFIDTTKAEIFSLNKLQGRIQVGGEVNGKLLQPSISADIFVKNIKYETNSIQQLKSMINFTYDDNKKIKFYLTGKNIYLGETLLNNIKANIEGTLKSHKIDIVLNILDNYNFHFSTLAGFDGKKTYVFTKGHCNIDFLNILLNPINMKITHNEDKNFSYQFDFHHNKEILSLIGRADFSFSNITTQLALVSHKFTVINTDAYHIVTKPNLHLDYNSLATKIRGTLEILQANIAPADLSETVTLTNDIVYVDNTGAPLHKKSEPLPLYLGVLLKIAHVNINYKGVKASIIGKLKLAQTPTTNLSAHGQLQLLQGSYKAYGQELTIKKDGTLSFISEIDNPQLNITASKEISVSPEYMILPSYQPYLIAGIQITGTANEPNIHLFSIPSGVSQQDILSYLIFGYPQSQLTNSQASALWNAFNMMGSGQSNFSLSNLQKSIQKEFGFSEFGLGNTSEYNATTGQYETGTAFVVGKRITDNLTATYNVGILVPVNVLYLRYQLSQHWSLQSDSSVLGNGGDIFYTIRRK